MGFIKFDNDQLVNLEYSLRKELIRSNRAGSYSCTTIVGCNTRKYHGLLICPQPMIDNGSHVLLSKLDETVIQRDAEFNIGISRYPGTYFPKGHKYIVNFTAEKIPVVTYRVGGVLLTKETLFVTYQHRVLVRYTLLEAQSPTVLRIRPFLAFRNIHALNKKNTFIDTKYEKIPCGIKTRIYQGYSPLSMQLSNENFEYIHAPDWYNDIEYYHERERGYDYREDLYVPGFFEVPIEKGQSIIFSAGIIEISPQDISGQFDAELNIRTPRNSFENSLRNSAEQFFSTNESGTMIIAGYPWYDWVGRYTFMSLPGLSLGLNSLDLCQGVLQTMISQMKGGNFPEIKIDNTISYISADTGLWFIWALSQCADKKISKSQIWTTYGSTIRLVLDWYRKGSEFIRKRENNLLYINPAYPAITWMNAIVNGSAVTPRFGYVVEVNALWYNAIMFAIDLAHEANDTNYAEGWYKVASIIPEAFLKLFWNENLGCLVDYVAEDKQNLSVRPNQVIAASVPFSPLTDPIKIRVLDTLRNQLLTPKGLRTLTPQDPLYRPRYSGDTNQRDMSLHQGTVWPWLAGHFAEAYLKVYKHRGVDFINNLYYNFEEDMVDYGVGTIGEFYEGDPPHQGKGASSFALSVAELLRINAMLKEFAVA